MLLQELIKRQKDFDDKHSGNFNWSEKISDNNICLLEHLLVAMMGEVGETANIIKKIIRGDVLLDDVKLSLEEEIADMFIYIMKMSYQLDIDLEKAFLSKLEKNKSRFKCYEHHD